LKLIRFILSHLVLLELYFVLSVCPLDKKYHEPPLTLRLWAAIFRIEPGPLQNVTTLNVSVLELWWDVFKICRYVSIKKVSKWVAVQVMMVRGLCCNWKQPTYDNFDQAVTKSILENVINIVFFCSTLSEFENFLLCERILINLTTCQNETSS
jgi:hypothetical protein